MVTDHYNKLIIITGSSGAGRTTAINVFEDIGFESIDNIPISMIENLVLAKNRNKNLALGVDIRTREFSPESLRKLVLKFDNIEIKVIFLDCDLNKLLGRFNETRRIHPLSGSKSLSEALLEEMEYLNPIKEFSDFVIDTTDYSPNDLREELLNYMSISEIERFSILLQSFSYKKGLPRNIDIIFDCRFLKNPYWNTELRDLDGNSQLIQDFVSNSCEFNSFFSKVLSLLNFYIPQVQKEGKNQFSVGFGCTGGKHRSVVLVNKIMQKLKKDGYNILSKHRDIIS